MENSPKSPVSCVIIEDNEIDRLAVQGYISKYSFLKLIHIFPNPVEALSLIRSEKIDVLFMDIDMPGMNGMDFFKSLDEPPLCVFITSHPEFALEGFEAHAFDYILKPLKGDRFEQAALRVKEYMEIKNKASLYNVQFENDFLTIKEGYEIIKIRISEIIYLEALKDYTKIITAEKKYITLANLKTFFDRLPEEKFIRIHRSFAVAKDKVKKLADNELFLENVTLPVGKTFKHEITRLLLG